MLQAASALKHWLCNMSSCSSALGGSAHTHTQLVGLDHTRRPVADLTPEGKLCTTLSPDTTLAQTPQSPDTTLSQTPHCPRHHTVPDTTQSPDTTLSQTPHCPRHQPQTVPPRHHTVPRHQPEDDAARLLFPGRSSQGSAIWPAAHPLAGWLRSPVWTRGG